MGLEVMLGVLVVGVFLQLRLRHRAHERGHADLALDVHRSGVRSILAPCESQVGGKSQDLVRGNMNDLSLTTEGTAQLCSADIIQ